MNELALFAGAGGGILGGFLLGWRTVCAVEINEYCRRVLMQRQDDGILEPFPIWSDIRTFDGRPWSGCVDIVTGGFPCQDISAAGKGAGIDGERSGLWSEMARVIREVRPRYVYVENSPLLVSRGLVRVLGDLAEMGFDASWGVVGAHHVGAPHKRDRIWILAHSDSFVRGGNVADSNRQRQQERCGTEPVRQEFAGVKRAGTWWEKDPAGKPEPELGRVAHGVANRVDRLRVIGNGQVPEVAATAWRILMEDAA